MIQPVRPWLQLIRLPNVVTAAADSLAGWLLAMASLDEPMRWLPLAAASMVLYASGTALNDVFDFEIDRAERPNRPIPSGQVARGTAAWLGGLGLLLGPALAGTTARHGKWDRGRCTGSLHPGLRRRAETHLARPDIHGSLPRVEFTPRNVLFAHARRADRLDCRRGVRALRRGNHRREPDGNIRRNPAADCSPVLRSKTWRSWAWRRSRWLIATSPIQARKVLSFRSKGCLSSPWSPWRSTRAPPGPSRSRSLSSFSKTSKQASWP